jgi:hypothetical protein
MTDFPPPIMPNGSRLSVAIAPFKVIARLEEKTFLPNNHFEQKFIPLKIKKDLFLGD